MLGTGGQKTIQAADEIGVIVLIFQPTGDHQLGSLAQVVDLACNALSEGVAHDGRLVLMAGHVL